MVSYKVQPEDKFSRLGRKRKSYHGPTQLSLHDRVSSLESQLQALHPEHQQLMRDRQLVTQPIPPDSPPVPDGSKLNVLLHDVCRDINKTILKYLI